MTRERRPLTLFIFAIFILNVMTSLSLEAQDRAVLDFYRSYGSFTDPGEYGALYKNLPESLADLCRLIKAQMIHPVAYLPLYRDLIPPERSYEDLEYPTVQTILAGLMKHNPAGLTQDRKPGQRLVVSCRYHAILLASILKSRGIPARVRYGFAGYLYPGRFINHVICEVWNDQDQRWMLVDPDRQMVDFSSGQFETSDDVWRRYRQGGLDSSLYGVPDWWGAHPILDVLCHDIAAVLGNERTYLDRPPVSFDVGMDVDHIPSDREAVMNKAAELLKNPDANFKELQVLYDTHAFLQFK
jgi:hypothetical protein